MYFYFDKQLHMRTIGFAYFPKTYIKDFGETHREIRIFIWRYYFGVVFG